MAQPSNLLADDPRRIPIDPERLKQLDYAQRLTGSHKKGIYNAELKGPEPLWKQIIGGMMGDTGLGPMPMMASERLIPESLLNDEGWMSGALNTVRKAALKLTGGDLGKRVYLKDIRPEMELFNRSQQDQLLKKMQDMGKLTLMKNDVPSDIDPAQQDAALPIGDKFRHFFYLKP